MKIKESLNATFDETPPSSKTSPLMDNDLHEEAIKVTKKKNLENEIEDETLEDDEIVNIKESKNHPLDNVIGKLNQRTLRNKHFPEKIASNLKFLNSLQPEWSRHVTIVHQTKDMHTADYTQLYDFLKYNQKEVDELRVDRLAKSQ
ncbi:hypothetical protein Tco_0856545 [Tanacetum coccineum]|uniref:Gag-Pol polyprotein n=1 Tax=Tanacetum coccineum TaxID=301880 RepID=A0ABQ5B4Q9_9ASTR